MSIIHDALKKVQQGLNSKSGETGVIEEPVQEIEVLPPANPSSTEEKPPEQNKFKTFLAILCALVITAGSLFYIWQQLQINVPKVQVFTRNSINKLIHKIKPNDKPAGPVELKSLAQLTITPEKSKNSTAGKPAPVTFNIHGIMANGTGNLALINDQVYEAGDMIDGAKITKINLDSITIINNGEEQTIPVKN